MRSRWDVACIRERSRLDRSRIHSSFVKKMAPGVKTTTKMKHTENRDEQEGAFHGHEEEKSSHGSVLIEKPGASQSSKLDGSGLRIAIIASCWYEKVVDSLVEECSKELLAKGVADEDLHLMKVTGAFEIPFAAARLVHCKDTSHRPDAVICIGCIVNDPTHMCEIMSQAVANGIMKLNVTSDTPVIFGVLCCDSEMQAHACAEKLSCSAGGEGEKCNHGVSWAQSALEMAHLKRCTSTKKVEQCHCVRCESRGGKSESSKRAPSKHESEKRESEKGESAKLENHGTCTTCGSSALKCSCKNCRGCGCPPDKCSCQDCHCAVCKTVGMKMPMPSHGHEGASKHESSSSSSGVKHGQSTECARCGSPGGSCRCGLLH